MQEVKAILLKITGRVQGVLFRAATKRVADELGVTGWVRNCDDGSVEVFAQGEDESLGKLGGWCRKGPKAAEVRNVEREEKALDETCESFEIRHA